MRAPLTAVAAALLLFLTSARAGPGELIARELIEKRFVKPNTFILPRDGATVTPVPIFFSIPTSTTQPSFTPELVARGAKTCTKSGNAGGAAATAPAAAPATAPAPAAAPAATPTPAPAPAGTPTNGPAAAAPPATTPAAGAPAPGGAVGDIPTAITGAPAPTGSITPAQYQQNLVNAKALNAVYVKEINYTSPCTVGQVACYEGKFGMCTKLGLFNFTACHTGNSCFAMPMMTVLGVSVGCVNDTLAMSVLGLTQAQIPGGPPALGALGSTPRTTSVSMVQVQATMSGGMIVATLPASGGFFSFTTSFSGANATGFSPLPLETALYVHPIH